MKVIHSLPSRALHQGKPKPKDITHDYTLHKLSVFLSDCIEHFPVESFQMSFEDNCRPFNHCLHGYDDHYHGYDDHYQKCAYLCVFSISLHRNNGSLTVWPEYV